MKPEREASGSAAMPKGPQAGPCLQRDPQQHGRIEIGLPAQLYVKRIHRQKQGRQQSERTPRQLPAAPCIRQEPSKTKHHWAGESRTPGSRRKASMKNSSNGHGKRNCAVHPANQAIARKSPRRQPAGGTYQKRSWCQRETRIRQAETGERTRQRPARSPTSRSPFSV